MKCVISDPQGAQECPKDLISAFSDFLGIFEENRPLIIRLGDFRPMPAHAHEH